MEPVHYYEEVYVHPVFQYVLAAVAVFIVAAFSMGLGNIREAPPGLMAVLSVLVVVLFLTFRVMEIWITDTMLIVGFGYLKHRVALSNIETVIAMRPPWWRYGGLGIRFGLDFSVAYLQNYGRGVRVIPWRGRVLYFSTANPDAVVNILRDRVKKLGSHQP